MAPQPVQASEVVEARSRFGVDVEQRRVVRSWSGARASPAAGGVRLRAAEALAAAGRGSEAAAQRAQAEFFYRDVEPVQFVRAHIRAAVSDTEK